MEKESFEDEEVARLLNDHYIAIKVDKEERPDIDTIYMTVCQSITGHGGWPLTILMTAKQKPFYAGTYLPKHGTRNYIGLMELLQSVVKMWHEERERLTKSSEDITRLLQKELSTAKHKEKEQSVEQLFDQAFAAFWQQFDKRYGGFGEAPKFPTPHNLIFLLRYAVENQKDEALHMVEKTLEGMYQGGIYDHIGGGFSRYSTDEKWLVPHFEKMLYDNALLVLLYTEAYQVTKKPLYEKVVKETLQYCMAEMNSNEGGFYCAQDADSEGEEGKYYVFTPQEVIDVLGEEEGRRFNQYYGITDLGNFENRSIPNRIGKELPSEKDVMHLWKKEREKLYRYRLSRMSLHKDDKILTSWNSLMIMALAKAFQVFGTDEYLHTAKCAYALINEQLRGEKERLYVRYREGQRFGLGNLEDYAFLIMAQITLYEATADPVYLIKAVRDTEEMIHLFWDEENGGFYFYGHDAEHLIIRPKEVYDGAIPSGNSAATFVLCRMAKITRNDRFIQIAKRQQEYILQEISSYPSAYTFSLCALMENIYGGKEIICIVKEQVDHKEVRQILQECYAPSTMILLVEEDTREGLELVAPYLAEYPKIVAESTTYICDSNGCHPPIYGMEELRKILFFV